MREPLHHELPSLEGSRGVLRIVEVQLSRLEQHPGRRVEPWGARHELEHAKVPDNGPTGNILGEEKGIRGAAPAAAFFLTCRSLPAAAAAAAAPAAMDSSTFDADLRALRHRDCKRTERSERTPGTPPPLADARDAVRLQQRDRKQREAENALKRRRHRRRQRREKRAQLLDGGEILRRGRRRRGHSRLLLADGCPLAERRDEVVRRHESEGQRVEQQRRPQPPREVERRPEPEEEALKVAPARAKVGPLSGPGLRLRVCAGARFGFGEGGRALRKSGKRKREKKSLSSLSERKRIGGAMSPKERK